MAEFDPRATQKASISSRISVTRIPAESSALPPCSPRCQASNVDSARVRKIVGRMLKNFYAGDQGGGERHCCNDPHLGFSGEATNGTVTLDLFRAGSPPPAPRRSRRQRRCIDGRRLGTGVPLWRAGQLLEVPPSLMRPREGRLASVVLDQVVDGRDALPTFPRVLYVPHLDAF